MKNLRALQLTDREPVRLLGLVLGAAIYAVGVNLFIVPAKLYTGGVMGICQIVRTVLVDYLHLYTGKMDIAGILYYMVNIPILLIAWHRIEHRFVIKTLVTVTAMTVFLSVIPVMDVLGGEPLTKSLIGGIIAGCGCGIVLQMGGTSGGMDVVGIMLMKKGSRISVGQINLFSNLVLYTICAIMFQLPTAIYSIIFAFISSFTVDKLHVQNINVEVTVITKIDSHDMEQEILNALRRGVTKIAAEGEYTAEPVSMLYILASKYEVNRLRSIISKYDPRAFVVVKNNAMVYGNYLKKL